MGLQITGRIYRYVLFPVPPVSGNLTFFTDLITFICIVAFAFRIKAKHGQLRMTRLLRTILQDSFLYFFVMAAFHVGIAFFTFFITVILSISSAERGI